MVRIDCHLHVFAKQSAEFPREVTDVYPAEREETAEKLLGEMEANGIDQAVLTQMGGAEPEHHNYVRRCVDTWPDRFRGIGLIPGGLRRAGGTHGPGRRRRAVHRLPPRGPRGAARSR